MTRPARWPLCLAAPLLATAIAATAHADPTMTAADQQFLAALGHPTTNTDTIIGLGHVICDNLAQGYTKTDLANSLLRNLPNLTVTRDQYIVDQAASAYCPWYR